MSQKQVVWWFGPYAYLAGFGTPPSVLAAAALVGAIFTGGWTLREASGGTGSLRFALGVMTLALAVVGTLILVSRAFRWPLLFRAVREYLRINMIGTFDFKDITLVGCAAGGAIAVGMVSKALQSLGFPLPRSLIVDFDYSEPGYPVVGTLLPQGFSLAGKKCLIVHSWLATGRSLKALRDRLGLQDAPVLCFVVAESLGDREKIDHYLHVGNRNVIPWPESAPGR